MARSLPVPCQKQIQINKSWCKGCGICVAICPRKALDMDSRGKATVLNESRCTGCGQCESHCPDFAIRIGCENND